MAGRPASIHSGACAMLAERTSFARHQLRSSWVAICQVIRRGSSCIWALTAKKYQPRNEEQLDYDRGRFFWAFAINHHQKRRSVFNSGLGSGGSN